MESLLTTKQVAKKLNVHKSRVYAMLRQRCPACGGEGQDCPRCKGTGHKLPHQETNLHSGTGAVKLIYPWALDLPDIRNRWPGGKRPTTLPDGVEIHRNGTEGKIYTVLVDGQQLGTVYRKGEARRSWTWETGDANGETYYRNRKDAIAALLAHSDPSNTAA